MYIFVSNVIIEVDILYVTDYARHVIFTKLLLFITLPINYYLLFLHIKLNITIFLKFLFLL